MIHIYSQLLKNDWLFLFQTNWEYDYSSEQKDYYLLMLQNRTKIT